MSAQPTFGRYAEIPLDQMTPQQTDDDVIESRGEAFCPCKIAVQNPAPMRVLVDFGRTATRVNRHCLMSSARSPSTSSKGTGRGPTAQKALKRSGFGIDDIGVYEVNEAFAPVPLAWFKDIGAQEKRLNPNGGVIARGHPLGGYGARIMTTMLHFMRDKGIQYGLQTMCEGGGQANATILELL
jgi:acetyl-CoA acetyltransferase